MNGLLLLGADFEFFILYSLNFLFEKLNNLVFNRSVFSFPIDSGKEIFKKNGFKYLETETVWVENGIFKFNRTDDNMLLLQYHYNVFKNNVMTLFLFHVKAEHLFLWVKIN